MGYLFDVKNIFLLLVGVINIIYGLLIYLRNRKSRINLWFGLVVLGVTFWVFSMFFFRIPQFTTAFLARMLYFSATLIPFFFLYLTFIFPEEKFILNNWQKYLLPIPFLVVVVISLLPDFLIKSVQLISGKEPEIVFNNLFYLIYGFYICGYFGWAYINLFIKYFKSSNIIRVQFAYIIAGTLISTMIGVTTNLTMPLLGNFSLNWLGQIMTVVMISFITYAILKYHLMNIKVITTELLIFVLWVIFLIRLFLADSLQQRMVEGGFFVAITIFGFMIIRSVISEVKRREEVERISKDLETANQRLQELDRIKTEFLSFATHQIKAPLTAVKGFASLIGDNSYGVVPEKVKEVSQRIIKAANRLVDLVNNILNLGRIESGKMEYNFEEIDFVKLVAEVVDDFKQVAAEKKLDLLFEFEGINPSIGSGQVGEVKIKADVQKLRQVVQNLIDNAIKYTEEGFVRVALKNEGQSVLLSVIDTGMGILPELLPHLFQKFVRETAPGQTIQGTGLGLYIAKEIIKAHNGEIWVESEGRGFGSQFFARLAAR